MRHVCETIDWKSLGYCCVCGFEVLGKGGLKTKIQEASAYMVGGN